MESIRIVQVGDIHFSDKENFASPVDNKDPGFPAALRDSIGSAPLQAVFRRLSHVIDTSNIDLISFMGDLTTRGDAPTLQECAAYIRRLLPDDWKSGQNPECKLIIGNHDIDRRLDPNTNVRFDNVNTAITAVGFEPASVLAPTETSVRNGAAAEARVFGVNSCRGCGQLRLLGSILEKHAGGIIDKIIMEGGTEQELDEIYESIDTPAIDNDTLTTLNNRIAHLDEKSIAPICAHHNLLPQGTPRLAPYSEIINGGSARAMLLSLGRPIIYLHGHLHSDPIEVIRVPGRPKSAVISIGAPLFRDGFNVIEIAFNRDSIPLGCKILGYRLDGSHVEVKRVDVISAWTAAEGLQIVTSPAREVMRRLEPDVVVHRGDLLGRVSLSDDELDDALRELWWLGVVEIRNQERPSAHWRVARSI